MFTFYNFFLHFPDMVECCSRSLFFHLKIEMEKNVILLFIFKTLGSLGYQSFHQRTLSASSSSAAKIACFFSAFLIVIFGIPSILIGAAAVSTGIINLLIHKPMFHENILRRTFYISFNRTEHATHYETNQLSCFVLFPFMVLFDFFFSFS